MVTLRAGGLNGRRDCPPFVEFDLNIGGFAYLFLPSVIPYSSGTAPTTSIIHGKVDKGFSPVNGITYASRLFALINAVYQKTVILVLVCCLC